jgi:hypothetical protein
MHTTVTGRIRKTALGRLVLLHINTGPFWIYGALVFWLALSLSRFWIHGGSARCLLSSPLAIIAAFTMPRLVHATLWHWSRSAWIDGYVITAFLVAILLSGYLYDIQHERDEALSRLATRSAVGLSAALVSYASNRKREA